MIVLAAVLAALIGVLLGLLGGGGSILTLPLLVYVLGLDAKEAIASSLFVVGTTSLVSALVHARAGRVVARVALLFGAAGMTGAFVGGQVSRFVPSSVLLALFGATMLATAFAMLRRKRAPVVEAGTSIEVPKIVALGLAVGAVSGLVGASGGFLVVPALAVFARLPMPRAIATSLMVIALQSLAGFVGHLGHVTPDPALLVALTVPCVIGSLLGAHFGARVRPDTLRHGFGFLVLAMGVFLSGKQLPAGTVRSFGVPAALVVVALVAVVSFVRRAGTESTP